LEGRRHRKETQGSTGKAPVRPLVFARRSQTPLSSIWLTPDPHSSGRALRGVIAGGLQQRDPGSLKKAQPGGPSSEAQPAVSRPQHGGMNQRRPERAGLVVSVLRGLQEREGGVPSPHRACHGEGAHEPARADSSSAGPTSSNGPTANLTAPWGNGGATGTNHVE